MSFASSAVVSEIQWLSNYERTDVYNKGYQILRPDPKISSVAKGEA